MHLACCRLNVTPWPKRGLAMEVISSPNFYLVAIRYIASQISVWISTVWVSLMPDALVLCWLLQSRPPALVLPWCISKVPMCLICLRSVIYIKSIAFRLWTPILSKRGYVIWRVPSGQMYICLFVFNCCRFSWMTGRYMDVNLAASERSHRAVPW